MKRSNSYDICSPTPEPELSPKKQELEGSQPMAGLNRSDNDSRQFIISFLCGIYALMLTVLGAIICLITAFRHLETGWSIYINLYYTIIFAIGIVVLILLYAIVLPKKTCKPQLTTTVHTGNNENDQHIEVQKDDEINGKWFPDVADGAEGVNIYMRIGVVAFGLGTILYSAFKISEAFNDGRSSTPDCKGVTYLVCTALQIVFTFFQTMMIFKHHKIVINVYKPLVYWGLWHLVATNICVWLWYEITEIENGIREEPETPYLLASFLNSTSSAEEITTETFSSMETNSSAEVETETETETETTIAGCYDYTSLAESSSAYLFPCTIEYSLLAAVILYNMLDAVGVPAQLPKKTTQEAENFSDCHKANSGLFGGLAISALTIIAVAVFFILADNLATQVEALVIFYVTEIVVMSITFVACIVGIVKLKYLRMDLAQMGGIDGKLLVIALGAIYVFHSFVIISSAQQLDVYGYVGALSIAVSACVIIQATLQVVFTVDGMVRTSAHEDHLYQKPGRSLVTFIIIANLAMWGINTFEVKKAEHSGMHDRFYGQTVWMIIEHISIPLIIFFRFHSGVCLSDVWLNAYIKKEE